MYFLEAEQTAIDLVDAPLPEFVFTHVVAGNPEIVIDAGDGRTQANDTYGGVCLSPPDTEIRYVVSAPHTVRSLAVPASKMRPLLADANLGAERFASIEAQHVRRPEIIPLMERMWAIVRSQEPMYGLLLDGLLLQYLAVLANATELSPNGPARRADTRIARAVDYIEASIGDALTVDQLAAVACLSPGHFSRTFKATMGEAVWAYVQRRRCERARDMLVNTCEPIAEIAYCCGFSSQAHMTRQLSARFGVAPGALRRGG